MSEHRNRLKTTISAVASAGLGDFTISTTSSGYRTFVSGDNALTFDCLITEGTTWEVRTGCTYTHSGTTLSRGTLEDSSTGSAITFTAAAIVSQIPTAAWGNNVESIRKDFITGLQMTWGSATSITVGTGAAYIQSSDSILRVSSAITASGLSLTASTWYHVYLYNNSGTPAIEVVTTAPATAFFGTARAKTSDTTRRYIGSVRATETDTMASFEHYPEQGLISYKDAVNTALYRVLSSGTATASTSVSVASLVASTSKLALLKLSNTDTATSFAVADGGTTATVTGPTGYLSVAPSVRTVGPIPLNASQLINYIYQTTPVAGSAFVDVLGYWYER